MRPVTKKEIEKAIEAFMLGNGVLADIIVRLRYQPVAQGHLPHLADLDEVLSLSRNRSIDFSRELAIRWALSRGTLAVEFKTIKPKKKNETGTENS